MKNWKIFVLIAAALSTVVATDDEINCTKFSSIMKTVRVMVGNEKVYNFFLEQIGISTKYRVFQIEDYNKCVAITVNNAKIQTIVAQTLKSEFNMSVNDFVTLAQKCNYSENLHPECIKDKKLDNSSDNVHSKYRPIDGRRNNLKHPEWGAVNTPFSRHGSKNYDDGIHSIKKMANGSTLPNARLLVQEVLMKAIRTPPPPPPFKYNLMALLVILFVTHDLHYQIPTPTASGKGEVQCCSEDCHDVLPPSLSNSACLPIEISRDDPFFKEGKIGCQNMVRSELAKYADGVETGEILNHATAYMDLSLIYGDEESELKAIRLYKGGKLRLGKKNILPVDAKGKYSPSMNRFTSTPIASIYPALFSRNHNHLAQRLAILNPHWTDEIIFQEARRINIANFQFNLITAKSIEKVFNKTINESYSDERNAATSVEFAFAYRGGHYYIPSYMSFLNENYEETKYLQSDTIGKIELLENDFDGALRGATNQVVNVGQYSDEIINRLGKDSNGYGVDLIAMDIQRGRDHGMPSFVDIRRKCKLTPEINSFDDFNQIFNKANVELLKKFYNSYEDVEFYVGGLLEAFESVGNPFAGPTFGCVIGENYNNVMGGDIYYYSHPENPHPFTKAQIDAVINYTIVNIYCTNSGLKETNKLWSLASQSINPKVSCKDYPQMDLSAWKE